MTPPLASPHWVSGACEGETCIGTCKRPATHKVSEEIPSDHPSNHPDPITNAAELAAIAGSRMPFALSAYVCCYHFRMIFGDRACNG